LDLLETELEATKLKPSASPRNTDQDEKWKKHYSEMMAQMEHRWKTAYEELEGEFDRKTKDLKDKNEEMKTLQKSISSIREDHE
jgi:nitrate/nitrite-specific signal transduction histidine kinase